MPSDTDEMKIQLAKETLAFAEIAASRVTRSNDSGNLTKVRISPRVVRNVAYIDVGKYYRITRSGLVPSQNGVVTPIEDYRELLKMQLMDLVYVRRALLELTK